jgi:hypothetical protein
MGGVFRPERHSINYKLIQIFNEQILNGRALYRHNLMQVKDSMGDQIFWRSEQLFNCSKVPSILCNPKVYYRLKNRHHWSLF